MIKPIILPQNNIINVKFVQVYLLNNGQRELPILRYNSEQEGYHTHILQKIVECELGLKLEMIALQEGGVAVKPRTDRYELCGAGRMNFQDGLFQFKGTSIDYEIGPNKSHFNRLQILEPKFKYHIIKNF